MAKVTGGGPEPIIEDWEDKMLEAIGEVAVTGVSGIDTFKSDNASWDNLNHVTTNSMPSTSIDSCNELNRNVNNIVKNDAENDVTQIDHVTTENNGKDETNIIKVLQEQNRILHQILEQQTITHGILIQLVQVPQADEL